MRLPTDQNLQYGVGGEAAGHGGADIQAGFSDLRDLGANDVLGFDELIDAKHREEVRRLQAAKTARQVLALQETAQSLIVDDYFDETEPIVPTPVITMDHAGLHDEMTAHRFLDTTSGRAAFIVTIFGLTMERGNEDEDQFIVEMVAGREPIIARDPHDFRNLKVFHDAGFFAIAESLGVNWTKTKQREVAEGLPYKWAAIHEETFMGRTSITPKEVASIPGVENIRR